MLSSFQSSLLCLKNIFYLDQVSSAKKSAWLLIILTEAFNLQATALFTECLLTFHSEAVNPTCAFQQSILAVTDSSRT